MTTLQTAARPVTKCPACGDKHPTLLFVQRPQPADVNGTLYHWQTRCPTSNETLTAIKLPES